MLRELAPRARILRRDNLRRDLRRVLSVLVYFIFFFSLLLPQVLQAQQAAPWNLPQELNDTNTQVSFAVDSTWHLVEGKLSGISGRVSQLKPNEPFSLKAEVHMPVRAFDTDNASRDEKMRRVMGEEKYPEVYFESTKLDLSHGTLEDLANGEICAGDLRGFLTIRGLQKPITLALTLTPRADSLDIAGKTELRWDEFGVEDPSILVAKLHTLVTISLHLTLPRSTNS